MVIYVETQLILTSAVKTGHIVETMTHSYKRALYRDRPMTDQ